MGLFFCAYIKVKMETTTVKVSSKLRRKLAQISGYIGNTPLLPFSYLLDNKNISLYAKAEWQQLSGSVKARAAYNIIKQAVESGALTEDKVLLDATSGNTGIAYATIAARLGLQVSLCLPENASQERKDILESLGVEIVYTSRFGGTDEAQEVAAYLAAQHPDKYFYADQYKNNANWQAHYDGTAPEIIRSLPGTTHFTAGLGTTGTFTGTGRRLRELNSNIQLVALQPDFALHGLEGWKHLETAIVPEIYDATVADGILEVSTEAAHRIIKKVAQTDGILLSPSAAANLAGAIQLASTIDAGTIVTILPDNGDKYSDIIKQII